MDSVASVDTEQTNHSDVNGEGQDWVGRLYSGACIKSEEVDTTDEAVNECDQISNDGGDRLLTIKIEADSDDESMDECGLLFEGSYNSADDLLTSMSSWVSGDNAVLSDMLVSFDM